MNKIADKNLVPRKITNKKAVVIVLTVVVALILILVTCVLIFVLPKTDSKDECINSSKILEIETTSGKLMGKCTIINYDRVVSNSVEKTTQSVYSWLAVPYAEPPINSNRFKSPIPIKARKEIIDATRWPNSCFQMIDKEDYQQDSSSETESRFEGFAMWRINKTISKMSEDCLYLNIFAPKVTNTTQNLLPIMVYFYGGSGIFGSSSLDIYNPSVFVAETNTIVVTVNYRLGIYGFLYLEGEFMGNQALQDQSEALGWISSNGPKFGGDPNKITVYGQSAGSILAGYHLFYEKSWPFYNNMIFQSGVPLITSYMPLTKVEANRRARDFLKRVGCSHDLSSNLADCALRSNSSLLALESMNYAELFASDYYTRMYLDNPFLPVIDGQVIKQDLVESLKSGSFKKCPMIIGFTKNEGTLSVAVSGLGGIYSYQEIAYSQFRDFVNKYFYFYPRYPNIANNLVKEAILVEYAQTSNETNVDNIIFDNSQTDYFEPMSDLLTDQTFVCPSYRFADLLAIQNTDVYMYLYDHYISSSPWPNWYKTTHSDELALVFGHSLSNRRPDSFISVNPWAKPENKYSLAEKKLTIEIFKFWSNFAKHDNPNGVLEEGHKWPKYKLNKMNVISKFGNLLTIQPERIVAEKQDKVQKCQFWNYLLPAIAEKC